MNDSRVIYLEGFVQMRTIPAVGVAVMLMEIDGMTLVLSTRTCRNLESDCDSGEKISLRNEAKARSSPWVGVCAFVCND